MADKLAFMTFNPLGVFATDEKGSIIAKQFFNGSGRERFEAMQACMKHDLSNEEKTVMQNLKDYQLVFEAKKFGHRHDFPNAAGEAMRARLPAIANEGGIDKKAFSEIMAEVNIEFTRTKMSSLKVDDRLLVQAVNTIDEMDKIINTMAMRLREWYGIYFPEIEAKLGDNYQFAKYVAEETFRKGSKDLDIEDTVGAEVSKEDLDEMKRYAEAIIHADSERKALESYVDAKSRQIAPNMHAIIGGQLTARMLARAGTMQKLASFPSSTLQILGAEKALFRFLKGHGTSPKYGLLFQSTYVQQAHNDNRGKIARHLASKLSIAAKLDYYAGKFMGAQLKQDMENLAKNTRRRETPRLHPKDRKR